MIADEAFYVRKRVSNYKGDTIKKMGHRTGISKEDVTNNNPGRDSQANASCGKAGEDSTESSAVPIAQYKIL
jgi:hypothetical protein